MKNILKLTLALLVLILGFVMVPKVSAFDPLAPACAGQGADSAACTGSKDPNATGGTATDNPVTDTITIAINIIAIVAGVAAVIMIIIGGITYITAGGAISGQRGSDGPKGAGKGRTMIVNSVFGLVIVALAWTIATFVVDKLIQ